MRPKQTRLIVSFHTTTAAMALESYCLEHSVPGRLIPVPRSITAGCGMAWSAPPEEVNAVLKAIDDCGIEIAGINVLEI